MKKLILLVMLISGVAKAQTFDFSCSRVPDGVYKHMASSHEFYYVENDRLIWVLYQIPNRDDPFNPYYCYIQVDRDQSQYVIIEVNINPEDSADYIVVFDWIDTRYNIRLRTLGKGPNPNVEDYEYAINEGRCPN